MAYMMDGIDIEKLHPRECPFCGEDDDHFRMHEFADTGRFSLSCECGATMSGDSVREVLDAWDRRA